MRRRQPGTRSAARTSAGTSAQPGTPHGGTPPSRLGPCTEGPVGGCLPGPPPRAPGRPGGQWEPRMRGGAHHTWAGGGAGQASPAQHLVSSGMDREVKEEVQKLRSRVDVLEQVRSGLGTQGPRPAPRCLLWAMVFSGVPGGGFLNTDSLGGPWPGFHAEQRRREMTGTPRQEGPSSALSPQATLRT